MTEARTSTVATWPIFMISVSGLFLELTLIRWVTTEIRIFAYLQNTILVVCFLGLGMGALTCRKPADLKPGLTRLALLTLLLSLPPTQEAFREVTSMLALVGGQVIWGTDMRDTAWSNLGLVIAALMATSVLLFLLFHSFVPIGRILGRLLDDHPRPILAYSVNVAGSLVGTLLSLAMGALHAPPVVWFGLFVAFAWPFLARDRRRRAVEVGLLGTMVLAAGVASLRGGAMEVAWSPYQKLTLWEGGHFGFYPGDLIINVNNTGYQGMIDLRSERIQADTTGRFDPALDGYSQYDIPIRVHDNPRRILLVGGGSGNDAAAALRFGVQDVTVVEIDPVILDMGRRYHPERPYLDERVTIFTTDARGFFSTSDGGYDLVVFGLLDSHTNLGMTNARLDHYVYTKESIELARGLLAPGGIAVLSFAAQEGFVADRMAGVLREVFGEGPLAFQIPLTAHGWGGVMFIAGNLRMARENISADPHLRRLVEDLQRLYPLRLPYTTRATTDNWPYIYLKSPGIPPLFFLLAGLVLGLFFLGRRMVHAPRELWAEDGTSWHFFFLGAAFLLLEVQNISKATIALGSTWWVNGIIIAGVLIMILLANLLAFGFPRIRRTYVYVALLATCGALYFLDLSQFAAMPFAVKAPIVGVITCSPMLFSGLIFIRSFAATNQKDIAIGANLLGALVGALLEPVTFLVGVRFLLLLVAVLYLCSWVALPGTWVGIRRGRLAPT